MSLHGFRRALALSLVAGLLTGLVVLGVLPSAAAPARFDNPSTPIFINEIHYDNTGTDSGEAVEIAGPAGTDLTGWSVVLYNGANGLTYDTTTLAATIPDLGSGYGVVVVSYPTNGIQNGPDGIALVDAGNNVIQFLSYEGTLIAGDGPATGMTSTDIGVAEGSGTAVGESLQLTGSGTAYGHFSWSGPTANTFGALNAGQSLPGPTPGAPTATPTPFPPTPSPTPAAPVVSVMEIQGEGHLSPYVGQLVTTSGVVTAVGFNGFYVQDPVGDGDEDTSDGLFVFMGNGCSGCPAVGDMVELTDTVEEFILGSPGTGNLSITELSFPALTVLSSGNPLPAPVIIGSGGRIPPNVDVISADELPVNLQTDPGFFDPAFDGIDFYESLEGMLVTVEDPVAVSATRTFNPFSSELFVLPNNGAHIAPPDARTARGGINLQPHPDNRGDQNPERVQIQFDGTLFPAPVPAITVGDRLGDVTGVVGYSFGNFEVNALAPFPITPSGLAAEVSDFAGAKRALTIASYNVLNLSPLPSDDAQRATLASQIVNNLGSPDIIALQEIQDNSGEIDDGTTDASLTLQALVDAIVAAGGPTYAFFDVAPADGTSGGVPGGNIRNAFLYDPERVDLVRYVSLTPEVLTEIGVTNPHAFDGTRDPLLAVFKFRGKEFTVINNHLTSRFGSTPVFGAIQPFVQAGEAEREAQAAALNEVVDFLLSHSRGNPRRASKAARVIVLGDLNTFEFTNDLAEILPGTGRDRVLTNLITTLTDDNVYTFNFEGNSQVLDHMFVTDNLLDYAVLDIVHVNVDFPRVDPSFGSDHEPLLVRIDFAQGKK